VTTKLWKQNIRRVYDAVKGIEVDQADLLDWALDDYERAVAARNPPRTGRQIQSLFDTALKVAYHENHRPFKPDIESDKKVFLRRKHFTVVGKMTQAFDAYRKYTLCLWLLPY